MLSQIYLKKLLILFSILFFSSMVIIYFWLKSFYTNELTQSLQKDAKLITLLLKQSNFNSHKLSQLGKELNIDITLLDTNGNIVASTNAMQFQGNLLNQPEFILAKEHNQSTFIRTSKISHKKFFYFVKQITLQNKKYYLRLAKSFETINHYIITLFLELLAIVILFFLLTLYFLYKIGLDIEYEVQKITTFLKDLTKKKKDPFITSNYSKEFKQITKMLTKVAKIINKRQKIMQKYTKKLEKSNRQKESIISAISHEFKNPLAVISGYAQTLLENENLDKALQKRFLQKIYDSSNKLNNLLNTLRLSITLDDNKRNINKSSISLLKLTQNVIASLQESFPNRTIIIQGEDINIEVDKNLFEIVIKNLIENALKYSNDEVIVYLKKDKISIVDKGIGIADDKIDKITKKFYRINKNVWNNSLGLGLYIVENIIKLHGFKLEIQSQEDKGSIFSVVFTN